MEKSYTEEQFQSECYLWFHNTFPWLRGCLFTVDNNVSHRLPPQYRVMEGARKKASGVVPGVSDMVFIRDGFCAFIELKLEKGVQSTEQIFFEALVTKLGHIYVIIKPPLYNFKNFINEFIH
jgi:hypothetical protein